MQGHGRISLGKDGDLDYAAGLDEFSYLKQDGKWAERDDVWFFHTNGKGEVAKGRLRPGLGANETSVGGTSSSLKEPDMLSLPPIAASRSACWAW